MSESIARVRLCRRCGNVGAFSSLNPWAKVCDACLAAPVPSLTPDNAVRWGRARNQATRTLIERHRSEYDALLSEAREEIGDEGWRGATLREIDDYDRRRAALVTSTAGQPPS